MCLGDTTAIEGSLVIAQKILSCIARTNQRFGALHVIAVLRGQDTERIRTFHHNELSTYGLLKEYSQPELRDFIYQLMGQGALAQENLVLSSGHSVPILKLNQRSLDVMKGKTPVRLIQIVRKTAAEARQTRALNPLLGGRRFRTLRHPPRLAQTTRRQTQRPPLRHHVRQHPPRTRPPPPHHPRKLPPHLRHRPRQTQRIRPARAAPHRGPFPGPPSTCPINRPPPPRRNRTARAAADYAAAESQQGAGVQAVPRRRQHRTGRRQNRPLHSTITEYLAEFIEREKPDAHPQWVPDALYKQIAAAAMEAPMHTLKPLFIKLEEKVPYDSLRLVVAHLRARNAL